MLEEQRLDKTIHDRRGFDCGVPELNRYLSELADQHRRKSISNTFVLVDSDNPGTILAYYSLSSAEVALDQLAPQDQKGLPRLPFPCIRMGRLATDLQCRGTGVGRLLIGCAVDRCLRVREEIAARALLVDAKNDQARRFYRHYGFVALPERPDTLYLPFGRGG